MSTTLYDIGDVARLTCTFTVGGVNTDPTTVTLEVLSPGWYGCVHLYMGIGNSHPKRGRHILQGYFSQYQRGMVVSLRGDGRG